ncbi:succinyl-diaminopimelate desuccinylase [Kitasatospora purpeofusca]|uniref:succinyl-diaminopimelate desuccinylase n=1 Tax=Kitasatospora purpeofusca TaxID=67352 RepID=UPI0036BBB617
MTGPGAGGTSSLDLSADPIVLTAALVDIPSVSGGEDRLADAIERALRGLPRLDVHRVGNTVVAATSFGRAERVVLAGHIDTVEVAGNVPSRVADGALYGCGTCDMKSGVAVQLKLARTVGAGPVVPDRDLTFVFYECEEVGLDRNGLGLLARERPEDLAADLAVLLEPTDCLVEAGCQGSLLARIAVDGVRAHSARSWLGDNALHRTAPVLDRLAAYEARRVEIDGLVYREGLNAVRITGSFPSGAVPDRCELDINFRFAPDRSEEEAAAHVRELFGDYAPVIVSTRPGALPGLGRPIVADFAAAVGGTPRAKFGWTDVARFAQLGVPAVNYGPGNPDLAHKPDEHVLLDRPGQACRRLGHWLGLPDS